MPSRIFTITATPTVDTAIYTAGDLLSSVMTFANAVIADGSKIQTVVVTDVAKQSAAMDLVLFSTALPNTTATLNAAFAPHATDHLNYIGHVAIAAADYSAFNANSAAVVKNVNLAIGALPEKSIYGVLVSRGTPTYAAATDIQVKLILERY